MITRRVKVQLLVFVVITLLGVSFVGARYARLDRLVRDDSYTVTAHFAEAGGIFAGAEVTYRGVGIGQVQSLKVVPTGVDVDLDVQNGYDKIPSDTMALVGNGSAVGEQYVELQPRVDDGPYLKEGSQIALNRTKTPIQTDKLLTDVSDTVSSINKKALHTTVTELGKAFAGTGPDLQRLIDSGNSFLNTANANYDVTARLIDDSNTVLNGQIASESAIRTFAKQLKLFSGTLADADPDLRKVIDDGSFAANQLRGLIEDNRVDLGELLNNLVTTGDIVVKHLPGIKQLLVVYPYVVEGGFTVAAKDPITGHYNAHFGLVLTTQGACTNGYQSTDRRSPQDRFENRSMNFKARCADPPNQACSGSSPLTTDSCNVRGAQNIDPRPRTRFRGPTAAYYDPDTRKVTWGDRLSAPLESPDTVAPASLGKESWKWLYLQPMVNQ